MAIRTKVQLESDKNTLLASASDITASEHRNLVQNLIDSLEGVIQQMTYAQMLAIASPALGDKVYVTDFVNKELFIYNGTYWKPVNGCIVIESGSTTVATEATTDPKVLATKSIGANYLLIDGDYIVAKGWGLLAANTNGKNIDFSFGASVLDGGGTISGAPANNKAWYAELIIQRVSASVQKIYGSISASPISSNFGAASPTNFTDPDISGAEDLTTAITIQIIGENAVANAGDITLEGWIITLHRI